MIRTTLVSAAFSVGAVLAAGACHVAREVVPAPLVSRDASEILAPVPLSDAGLVDAAETELTVARATAMLVVRNESLRLPHGGELAGPCVDWTRRVQRLEYSEDPASEPASAADRAAAALVPAERVSGTPFDIDGDGQDDVGVLVGAADITTTSEVFVLSGSCGYKVGLFESQAEIRVLSHRSHGLFDLGTVETLPLGGHTYEVTYRFDGHAYRPAARRRIKRRDPRVNEIGL
jgi:hypothetical protein